MSRAQRKLLERCNANPGLRPTGSARATIRVLELMHLVARSKEGTFSVTDIGRRKLASLPVQVDMADKVLGYLCTGGDGATATVIANALSADLQSTIRAITRLQSSGIVEKRLSASNGRVRQVHVCRK